MTLFSLVGGIGLVMMILSMIIFKVLISSSMVAPLIESFIELLSQAINSFNRRIFIIFMQFILVSNTLFYGVMWLQGKQVSASLLFSFDASLVVFGGVIYIMLKFVPHALSAILANGRNGAKSLINQIILAGFFQTLSFFGVFLSIIFIYIILFDATALLALSSGVLVVSFYYRSAGGAYKAAAENKQGPIDSERRVLTHPSELLIKTGTLIASIGGYYMDIFGSWLIAIATFFIYVKTQVDVKSLLDVIAFAEIQWVLAVICFTGISMILAIPFAFIRKKYSQYIFRYWVFYYWHIIYSVIIFHS